MRFCGDTLEEINLTFKASAEPVRDQDQADIIRGDVHLKMKTNTWFDFGRIYTIVVCTTIISKIDYISGYCRLVPGIMYHVYEIYILRVQVYIYDTLSYIYFRNKTAVR